MISHVFGAKPSGIAGKIASLPILDGQCPDNGSRGRLNADLAVKGDSRNWLKALG